MTSAFFKDSSDPLLLCDVTQSYSAKGGGIRTYLREKRRYILENTNARHCLIVPGPEDKKTVEGRLTKIEIKSPQVPGSPNYRFLLRSHAVLRALGEEQPDLIECLDAYNLPWTALWHRRRFPQTVLVAGYHTDFPTVYVEPFMSKRLGKAAAQWWKDRSYKYAANLYRRFDSFYSLTEGTAELFETYDIPDIRVLTFGANPDVFHPRKRSADLRATLGVKDNEPLLIYAGRIDHEKKTNVVVDAFKKLPRSWNAALVMLGDGKARDALAKECEGYNAHFPGFVDNRETLAKFLASSDIYVSGMEDETFGISIIEAQASGLPVVGVRAGAMIDRVRPHLGRLGAPGDASEMAANISAVWMDRLTPVGDHARQHVLDNFCWSRTFEKLFDEIYLAAFERKTPRKEEIRTLRQWQKRRQRRAS